MSGWARQIDVAENRPGLRFLPSGTPEGFASKAVSSDNDANPSVIVRELIQNSLDAGTASGSKTQVDFVFDEIPLADIPGIETYRSAFRAARSVHSGHVEAAEAQIERMATALEAECIPVLQVRDNGIGLDTPRINALLSDGLTNKSGAEGRSAGSYGLGHYTAFPASDLQYILYGGLTAEGVRTMSGHAILASHFTESGDLLGKDGYFISGEPQRHIRNRYRFPEHEDVPGVVDDLLDSLQATYGCGSVVAVLGFNDFRRPGNDPAEAILRVAARHFYPVIRSGHLTVRTVRGNDVQTLDDDMAMKLLHRDREEARSRADIINGNKAYLIWKTLQSGKREDIATDLGTIRLYIRDADPGERTRISLFRSGMFITDAVPRNRATNFGTYRRFNAVVLVGTPEPGEDDRAFMLVRQAEGEKHASIDRGRLPREKQRLFDDLFRNIRQALEKTATLDDSKTHVPEGFMELELSGGTQVDARPAGARREADRAQTTREFIPVPETLEDFPQGPPRERREKRKPKPKSTSTPSGRRVAVRAAAKRVGRDVRLVFSATADVASAVVRILADQGGDASCTNPLADRPLRMRSAGASSSYAQELRVGSLVEGQRHELELQLESEPPEECVLKVDVFSRGRAPTQKS